jgi:hypothetical protein
VPGGGDLPERWQVYARENTKFFAEPLPGRDEPLGLPGGAGELGVVGADTPFVAALPPRE